MCDKMTFSDALIALKEGKKVSREEWTHLHLEVEFPDDENKNSYPLIYMVYRDVRGRYPWLAYQRDLMSDDWVIL